MNPKLQTVQDTLTRAGIHTAHCDKPHPWELLRVHGNGAEVGTHNTIIFIPTAEPDTLTLRTWIMGVDPAPTGSPHQDTRFDLRDQNMYGKLIRQIIKADPESSRL